MRVECVVLVCVGGRTKDEGRRKKGRMDRMGDLRQARTNEASLDRYRQDYTGLDRFRQV